MEPLTGSPSQPTLNQQMGDVKSQTVSCPAGLNLLREGVSRPALTKIVATLGPATSDADTISKLIDAGVSVFRFNFSHGSEDDHQKRLHIVRAVSADMGRPIAILGDLPGPKIRVGEVEEGGINVPTGATAIFQRKSILARDEGDPYRFSSRYDRLVDDAHLGQRLLIADGTVRMLIVDKNEDSITCSVTHGGVVTSGKGINLPDTDLTVDILGERDRRFIKWAVEHEVDYFALSFVRSAKDIQQLIDLLSTVKADLDRADARFPIIAKIELPRAVQRIDEILEVADGIMVARGDLGVEMDLAQVPMIQKQLIAAARSHARPCIVATQMLESMIESPTPTRAEASDIAGAIFDGADSVMLSGETAIGKFPVLACEYMRRIAQATEAYLARDGAIRHAPKKPLETRYRTACLAHGVAVVARDLNAKFIVVWSQQGGGARHISQFDLPIPILAASTDERALRRMQLMRGVTPIRMNQPDDLDHFTAMVDAYLMECGWAQEGDPCILVAGGAIGTAGVTNSLAIHTIGKPDTGFRKPSK